MEVEFYPEGNTEKATRWISAHLYSGTHKLLGIRIKYEFFISQFNEVLEERQFTHKFEKLNRRGYSKFAERSKLSLKNDSSVTITINSEIEVLGTYITSSLKTKSSDMVVPFEKRKNRITNHFQSLYKNPKFTDFTVICGEMTFPTHKLILASRCPVFAAMFEHKEMEENVKNELKIENIGPDVVAGLLKFSYIDDVSEIEELAHELLAAAEQYRLEDLKNLCEEALYTTLEEDNAAELPAIAHLHNAHQLRNYAMQCIAAHSKSVAESEVFKSVELTSALSRKIIPTLIFPASEKSTN